MNLSELAEHRIRLLIKKSNGEATENDLEQLTRLAKSMSEIPNSVTSEKDKEFMKYADKTIATLESKSDLSDDLSDLDFSKS